MLSPQWAHNLKPYGSAAPSSAASWRYRNMQFVALALNTFYAFIILTRVHRSVIYTYMHTKLMQRNAHIYVICI